MVTITDVTVGAAKEKNATVAAVKEADVTVTVMKEAEEIVTGIKMSGTSAEMMAAEMTVEMIAETIVTVTEIAGRIVQETKDPVSVLKAPVRVLIPT